MSSSGSGSPLQTMTPTRTGRSWAALGLGDPMEDARSEVTRGVADRLGDDDRVRCRSLVVDQPVRPAGAQLDHDYQSSGV